MTLSKYLVCRLAASFGYVRKNIRMGQAAAEMHLLREAEAHLGEAIWRNVEDIENLSMEYWNLRKLIAERTRISDSIMELQQKLQDSHAERSGILQNSGGQFEDLHEKRKEYLSILDVLSKQRDIVIAKARDVRRNYEGLRTKQEVLGSEGGREDEIQKAEERLAELKETFADLKKQREAIAAKIRQTDIKVDSVESEIEERKQQGRGSASKVFQQIGEANQKMSTLKAEFEIIETKMRQLYSEIGRYVSRHSTGCPACRAASRGHTGLIEVMAALRKSILFNHKLADLS